MVVTLKSDRVESVVQRIEGAHLTLCTPKSDVLDPLPRHLGTLCGDPLVSPPTINHRVQS